MGQDTRLTPRTSLRKFRSGTGYSGSIRDGNLPVSVLVSAKHMHAPEKNLQVTSVFDTFSKAIAAPLGRRGLLKMLAASVAAAFLPKKAAAAVFPCGSPVSVALTASNPLCDATLTATLCAGLLVTVQQNLIALCPGTCPIGAVATACVCNNGTVTANANAICVCTAGTTPCGNGCCAAGSLCCGGQCVPSTCANCGTCGNVCPAGSCCVNGQCATSGVQACC